jgi:hypothetical protein
VQPQQHVRQGSATGLRLGEVLRQSQGQDRTLRQGRGGDDDEDPARSTEVVVGGGGLAAEPQDRLSKATGDTQATESTAPIAVSSSDLSCDKHHRVNGRLTMVTRARSDGGRAAAAARILSERCHVIPLQQAEGQGRVGCRPGREGGFWTDPRRGRRSSRSERTGSKSRGFVRKMSSVFGGCKKSYGAE